MTHAPEIGAINPLHFSGADFWCVCHGPNSSFLLQTLLLQSMRKYQPRFHVFARASDLTHASGRSCPPSVKTFQFNETQFIAVTAYQNHRVCYS